MHTLTPYTTGTKNMNPDSKTKGFEVEALHIIKFKQWNSKLIENRFRFHKYNWKLVSTIYW